MSKPMKLFTLIFLVAGFLISFVSPALAESCPSGPDWMKAIIGGDGLLIPKECICSQAGSSINSCGLNAVMQTIINFSNLLLALTGSAALLMFTYGGVLFIISAGSQEKVKQGMDAMKAAAIGIAIILGSWLIVNFTINALTGGEIGSTAQIFSRPWSNIPDSSTQAEPGTPPTGYHPEGI